MLDQMAVDEGCNIMEIGDATLWKNNLQLGGKSSCKKHQERTIPQKPQSTCSLVRKINKKHTRHQSDNFGPPGKAN